MLRFDTHANNRQPIKTLVEDVMECTTDVLMQGRSRVPQFTGGSLIQAGLVDRSDCGVWGSLKM